MLILVLNCGSSSVKFALIDSISEQSRVTGLVENIGSEKVNLRYSLANGTNYQQELGKATYQIALQTIVPLIEEHNTDNTQLSAVAHRVVHGGSLFTQPVIIDQQVLKQIESCIELAPLHNPANLAGILAAQQAFPKLPQIAVFDTAFHQTMPEHAYLYALPYNYYQDYSIRRYGFHGISYQYLVQAAAKTLDITLENTAFVCAHLGNGCSATAVLNGKSIDTTMGFTPLEGLVMGTRSGDIDPGLFSYLADKLNYSIAEITHLLNKQSGLLGISGLSMDMRTIEKAAGENHQQAILAVEIFCYRLAKYIAALVVPLGRIDALIFSGGIGENSAAIRAKTLSWLKILNFQIDEKHNTEHGQDNFGLITVKGSTKALVIRTQEELMIAKDAAQLITQGE